MHSRTLASLVLLAGPLMIGEVHVHRIDGTWIEVFPEDDGARVDFGDLPPTLATAEPLPLECM